ncbi:DMT family transporter [Leptospira semungkisensis]|uniref:DMT family transporter n=1 Tax=Leptospira semungkisensis TaxID=2484985 RepID=A0A4R9FP37_9LEPT|nr:DMT family transporter [Leptospira semungkisensis]TGJ99526.1 DMT family transporter [Leptospira semungkisensis]
MNLIFPILIAIFSGLAMSIQPGINSLLGKSLESPWLASTVSFLVGTIVLALTAFALGEMKSASFLVQTAKENPWWIWTGGLLGAIVVTSALVFAPKLGATSWLALFLFGQVLTSILLEKWGILGFPEKPISLQKWVGMGLLILSAWLVRKG